MKVHNMENRFIPAFIFSSAIFVVMSPYLPLLVSDLGYSATLVGIMLGIYEGAGIAGPLVFGYWADRKNKYRLLLVISCLIPAVIAFPLALFVHPLATALFLAILAFCFKPNTSLLDAATTIQIGAKGNYGKIRLWGSIGFVCTTLILQWTPFFKPENAVHIAFWLMVLSAAAIVPILMLPLTFRGTSNRETSNEKQTEKLSIDISLKDTSLEAAKKPKIITLYCITGFMLICLSRFSMVGVYTFFPLYLSKVIQWNAVGLMFGLSASSEIPFFFHSRALIRRFGSLSLLALAATAVCVRLLIYAFFPLKPFIVIAQLLHSLSFGIYYPAAIDFISRVFPPEKRGFGMSLFLALGQGTPVLIANMAGGAIVERAGYQSLFIMYAAVSAAAVLVYGVLRKKISLTTYE